MFQQKYTGRFRARGTVLVAVLIALFVLSLVVMTVVRSGARDHDLAGLQVQGERAHYAAESAAHMAVKEVMDGVDRDGDGAIGSISNDNNTATDPTVSGARCWATKTSAGGLTTITARGENTSARRAVRVQLVDSGAAATEGTILLVVANASSLLPEEVSRRTLMQGWGYTVVPISATSSQAAFDSAVRTSSIAYIVETVLSSDVGTKLTNAPIGVITEESALSDEFGFSSSMTTMSATQIDIFNTSHYITSTLPSGVRTIYTSSQPVRWLSGTQGGYTALARQVSTSNNVLAVMERGTALTPSGTAAGKRVYLPWGNTGFDMASLNSDGQTIMRRSIEWCLLPVAHWKLDETSGSTASDSIAGRNGTLSGPAWTTGQIDNGLQFDGSNDYVSISDATAFQPTMALSIAGWIKGNSWPSGSTVAVLLRKGPDNPNNWQLCVANGQAMLNLDSNDGSGVGGNTTLSTGTWHHIAATWDGATVRIYVDGVLDNTPTALSAPINTDTRPVYLGGRTGNTDVTNGVVDDVRFYERALTAEEIASLIGSKKKVTEWVSVQP